MAERRAVRRIAPSPPLSAKVKTSLPARVIDISSHGAQIEVMNSLKPNVTCELRLRLQDADVTVRGIVRRCRAFGFGVDEREQRVLLYHAGLEFEEVAPEVLQHMRSYLDLPESGELPAVPEEVIAAPPVTAAKEEPPSPPVRPAPRSEGPVKIRISSEHVRKIIEGGKGR